MASKNRLRNFALVIGALALALGASGGWNRAVGLVVVSVPIYLVLVVGQRLEPRFRGQEAETPSGDGDWREQWRGYPLRPMLVCGGLAATVLAIVGFALPSLAGVLWPAAMATVVVTLGAATAKIASGT